MKTKLFSFLNFVPVFIKKKVLRHIHGNVGRPTSDTKYKYTLISSLYVFIFLIFPSARRPQVRAPREPLPPGGDLTRLPCPRITLCNFTYLDFFLFPFQSFSLHIYSFSFFICTTHFIYIFRREFE